MSPNRVIDMEQWKAIHLRPVSWYGVFYAFHSANLRILRAWMEFWR